jgi:glutaconate CoA-transferase subunit A
MQNKLIPLDSVRKILHHGCILGIGGMNLYRKPIALIRQIIKENLKDLEIVSFTASYESDLLVGGGHVARVRACYFGMESFGLAPMFSKAAVGGRITIIEETEATLVAELKAALNKTGFMVIKGILGSDILKVREDIKIIPSPYDGEKVVVVPPLKPDFALIHVQKADSYGNAQIAGNLGIDNLLAQCAGKTIISAEEIVDSKEMTPGKTDILGLNVFAVVHCPGGAKPTSCYPHYHLDGFEILRYVHSCLNNDFKSYIETFLGES